MKGLSRVIIENVQPQIDDGIYAVKRTVGERVDVTANIFGDGHDHIRARVLYKKVGNTSSKKNIPWKTVTLTNEGNDEWIASFHVLEMGKYVFTIAAWIDHFETWYDGFKKKVAVGLDVHVELMEGANMLRTLAGGKNQNLLQLADSFENKNSYDSSIQKIISSEFDQIVRNNPLVEVESVYEKELEIVVEPKKANFSAWYELFPRSASLENRHGTFQDVIRLLPRVASMGFDVLYFPPIHPIGKMNRKGKNNNVKAKPDEPGSPWAIGSIEGGHKAIHPELGTLEDYKRLIQEASKHGIDIAFDLAFQCAPDHPYVTEHPEWFKQRPDGSIQYAENPPKKYQDIFPFNFECEAWQSLWHELRSVVFYWIEQGVKIFRVDNPHTKPIPFWQWIIEEVNKQYTDIIFLSEAFTRPKIMASLAKVGFTQSYTYFTWRVNKSEIISYMTELVQGSSRNYFRPNFWPNTPDILPFHLQHQRENIFIIRLALAATLSSNYGIYGPPYEFCENEPMDNKEEYNNSEKYEVKHYDWRKTNRITDIITILNKTRKEHEALQSTWNIEFCAIENPNLIAYLKITDDLSDVVLVVVNLDPHNRQSGFIQLPKSHLKLNEQINLKLYDVMMDEHYTWTQEWNYVEIDPYQMPFHLFTVKVHESNM